MTTWRRRIRAVQGVKYALPLVEGQVMISTPTTSSGALVRGLRETDLKQLKAVSGNIRFGTLDGFDTSPGVALGSRLANELNVKVGDQVSLLTPRGASTALGTAPRVKRYPVVAIFEIGMSEYDSSIMFMPLNEAQLYFNQPDSVTVLEVVLDSPDEVGAARPQDRHRRRLRASMSATGGSGTPPSSPRSRSSATSCS